VGAADIEDDGMPFSERFSALGEKLEKQFEEGRKLEVAITKNLARLRV